MIKNGGINTDDPGRIYCDRMKKWDVQPPGAEFPALFGSPQPGKQIG